ncbi:toxin-antitoxin system YwqK family antitoxin [Persicobacter psychrovividus]|uniref:Toxin-antitoxin system YwqK family antitoxin n=1 Tax=Persicobacter psychrovividus TaxID=387638 RepID=A0ABN6LCM9_9BACT|nr:hypothetical protein PEPS_32360 [Persicobacter psychrovividus]
MNRLILWCLLVFSCSPTKEAATGTEPYTGPNAIRRSALTTTTHDDRAYYQGQPFSGSVYDLSMEADTVFKGEYQEGRPHGLVQKWYESGERQECRYFSDGLKDGPQVAFWKNGNKCFEYTAEREIYQGKLQEWNVDGQLIHLAHYKDGQEEGEQKLWYDNGKIRANYVIINGRRYGLLGTKNCVNVSDSLAVNQ